MPVGDGPGNAIIEHEPGDETQWEWLDLPDPPASWGWGRNARLLVGSLAHSSKWRASLEPATDQPHLVQGLDRVTRALGGVTRTWRFDRMSTVCDPGSGRITASFAGVAKHYSVAVAVCPPRRGNRKGVVEKTNHTAAQRWWRTLPDDVTVEQAQADLDRFASVRGDTRMRATPEGKPRRRVADTEPLHPVPAAPYPVIVAEERNASRQALVGYRGNRYSVPPELAAHGWSDPPGRWRVHRHRHHRRDHRRPAQALADGLGATVRDSGHVIALDAAAMAAASSGRGHRRKQRIPPGPEARAAAAELRKRIAAADGSVIESQITTIASTVTDLSAYERAAQQRSTLP